MRDLLCKIFDDKGMNMESTKDGEVGVGIPLSQMSFGQMVNLGKKFAAV